MEEKPWDLLGIRACEVLRGLLVEDTLCQWWRWFIWLNKILPSVGDGRACQSKGTAVSAQHLLVVVQLLQNKIQRTYPGLLGSSVQFSVILGSLLLWELLRVCEETGSEAFCSSSYCTDILIAFYKIIHLQWILKKQSVPLHRAYEEDCPIWYSHCIFCSPCHPYSHSCTTWPLSSSLNTPSIHFSEHLHRHFPFASLLGMHFLHKMHLSLPPFLQISV